MANLFPFHWPVSLSTARLRGGIVILDPSRDTYEGFYVPDVGSTDPADRERAVREALATAGCANPFQDDLLTPPHGEGATWSELDLGSAPSIRFRHIAAFSLALLRASMAFHGRSFGRLLSSVRRAPRTPGSLDDYRIVLARFERLCLFLPFPMLCLFRSHFLLLFLRSQGLAADWIFGVSLFPFRAHCWLAVGDRLLGETCERIQDLVPIHRVASLSATPT